MEMGKPRYKILGIVIILIFGLWLFYGILTMILFKDCWAQRGQFGDMFGGINALFAGLAFACLIYTIYQQQNHFREQINTLSYQLVLDIYFKLMDRYDDIRDNLKYPHRDAVGAEIFNEFYSEFDGSMRDVRRNNPNLNKSKDIELQIINKAFEKIYKEKFYKVTMRYFSTVELVLSFINSNFKARSMTYYRELFISQFEESEFKMLFYYGLSERGKGIKNLFNKLGFFKYFDKSKILNSEHAELYDTSAFQDN